jgi:hypothetical protein
MMTHLSHTHSPHGTISSAWWVSGRLRRILRSVHWWQIGGKKVISYCLIIDSENMILSMTTCLITEDVKKRVNSVLKMLQPSVKCSTWQAKVLYKLTWPTESNVVIQAHIATFSMTFPAGNLPYPRPAPQCIQESI